VARPISEQRKQLWHALNAYITERGSAITTVAFASPLHLETPPESRLPENLGTMGWNLIDRGQETRLGPQEVTRDRSGRPRPTTGYAFRVMDVYEIALPR
jgi:hypothetical protein